MLLTITTTHKPATDLGYLLHKHPDKLQTFPLSIGQAHVYYPESSDDRCTVALQLEIDSIELVRSAKRTGQPKLLQHYVNDRPYVASSFMSVALNKVFRSAFTGASREKQVLADMEIPLEMAIYSIPCQDGESMVRRLFEPLGYELETEAVKVEFSASDKGTSADRQYHNVFLRGTKRVQDLLRHAYVLIPVLDQEKHYWVGDDEVSKLLRHGEDWLVEHPEKELITRRYLKSQRSLTSQALAQLSCDQPFTGTESAHESILEAPLRLNDERVREVSRIVEEAAPASVLDLGCGEGKLLKELLKIRHIKRLVGIDVSSRALELAEKRLRIAEMPEHQRSRIRLLNSSLIYRDKRLANFDLAIASEVIEHIEPDRLDSFERCVFEFAKPKTVIITTPNAEYNALFESMDAGQYRHEDHRFEWSREEFCNWVNSIEKRFGYVADTLGIGPYNSIGGNPTQMAVLVRE